ncbi:hypothetical protein J437_LFUL013151 [Ladona fulva]|uniref:TNF receptor-associated factor 6 n=1 Tax=Ladona fulva TaxID=123851 RepID=A0A8K0KGL5_LADFU|nr:hypothetical protein J437_LFUL013151 [Ladona fulva]
MDPRYECPICLNYLEEAVVTSCGHRFCMKCINSWLQQNGSTCPIDVTPLELKDIFPDNFTRREILQIKQQHVGKQTSVAEDSNKKESPSQEKVLDNVVCEGPDLLLRALYERIILLEQRAHEQDIVVENLRRKIAVLEMKEESNSTVEEETALRCCNGLFLWKIRRFSSQLQLMMDNQGDRSAPPQMLYSPSFYTHPTCGYRFCARINLSKRNPSHLSLLIHVVRGDYDDILPWPFTGNIKLELINQREGGDHLVESMTVGGEGCPRAFSRPPTDGSRTVNPRGFGYMEFVAIADLTSGGFLQNDTLVIRVKVEHDVQVN